MEGKVEIEREFREFKGCSSGYTILAQIAKYIESIEYPGLLLTKKLVQLLVNFVYRLKLLSQAFLYLLGTRVTNLLSMFN